MYKRLKKYSLIQKDKETLLPKLSIQLNVILANLQEKGETSLKLDIHNQLLSLKPKKRLLNAPNQLVFDECLNKLDKSKKSFAVIGDRFGLHITPMLRILENKHSSNIIFFEKNSNIFMPMPPINFIVFIPYIYNYLYAVIFY